MIYLDFEEEREAFWSDIYPEIQNYCLHLGAELVVFDPYQGADTDICESPQNVELMIQEIHRCQQYSTGICFLVSTNCSIFCYSKSSVGESSQFR